MHVIAFTRRPRGDADAERRRRRRRGARRGFDLLGVAELLRGVAVKQRD